MRQKKERFIIVGLGNRGRDSFARALLAFPERGFPEFRERADIGSYVVLEETGRDYPPFPPSALI